ncbi:HK97 family phage prohead protease [Thalassospira sp.]|uniref:HK97 family phage prohead protease n=1 Tax=Thalassospira sp. TaxID=1912094 RepID=UPI001B25BC19|nr:HK97 family phage prohead protease [Thalassospira sp.]MBO6807269.1 HK97 family phage prohead protease [Thalassospira sp.]MBO6841676.1 HK97 family phage prohead protease [Thalassospira sp.]
MTEFPNFSFEIKSLSDSDGTFSGYASVWGLVDSHGDMITQGAFTNSLRNHRDQGTTPVLLWSHDQANPVGRWMAIQEDTKGLAVTGKLNLKTSKGREAYELMKDGSINGLSIGFRTVRSEPMVDGGRKLLEVDLQEISIVSIPSAGLARILEVKSWKTARDAEKALRDAGMSRREAKAFVCGGFKSLSPEQQDLGDAITRIKKLSI